MIYIMRHGKTDWNAVYKLQGRVDIPLNEEGRQMAVRAGEEYRKIPFDICYSSPLKRARETAELFLKGTEVPIETDERLLEMSFGVCEGNQNIFSDPSHPVYKLFKDPVNYETCEAGEGFADLYARAKSFLDTVAIPLSKEGKNVLIVGHGALNNAIIGVYKGTPLAHFWDNMTGNCEVKLLE